MGSAASSSLSFSSLLLQLLSPGYAWHTLGEDGAFMEVCLTGGGVVLILYLKSQD